MAGEPVYVYRPQTWRVALEDSIGYAVGVLLTFSAMALTITKLAGVFASVFLILGAVTGISATLPGRVSAATIEIGGDYIIGPGLWGKRHRLQLSNSTVVPSTYRRLIGQLKVKSGDHGPSLYIRTRCFGPDDLTDMLRRLEQQLPT